MREASGDLFGLAKGKVLCLTTNGTVKKSGEGVMGAGCAKQAANAWPGLPKILGAALKRDGNIVSVLLGAGGIADSTYREIVSFPVKHNWWEVADISLIERSAKQLVAMADQYGWDEVFIPRPGCGNGKLEWEQVRPVLEPVLDDRFILVTF